MFCKKDGVLNLESINTNSSFQEVSNNTGFPISKAPFTDVPSEDELKLIRDFDKEGIRDIEF